MESRKEVPEQLNDLVYRTERDLQIQKLRNKLMLRKGTGGGQVKLGV